MTNQPRRGEGEGGGQFVSRQRSAPAGSLAGSNDADIAAGIEGVIAADPATIDGFVASAHWQVRAEAVDSDHVGDAHLEKLSSDPDPMVRMAIAGRVDSPAGRKLIHDRSPLVRLVAALRPDTAAEQRHACLNEPGVRRLAAAIGVIE